MYLACRMQTREVLELQVGIHSLNIMLYWNENSDHTGCMMHIQMLFVVSLCCYWICTTSMKLVLKTHCLRNKLMQVYSLLLTS
jgi:hypothetical protein